MRARAREAAGSAVLVLAAGLSAAAPPPAQPLNTSLDRLAITEAVRLGLSRDTAALDRFHAPYRQLLGGPFLQSVELISEFRRVVLSAERASRAGETWDPARAERALEPFRGLVTVVVHVRFNPQNTYRSMPRLEAVIYRSGGGTVAPVGQRARPSYLSGPAPPGTPVIEGTLEADFRASSLEHGGEGLVGISLEGREVQRIPLALGGLR